jgi:tripartite-type tricarboxylate transporter receptor subunit TctC
MIMTRLVLQFLTALIILPCASASSAQRADRDAYPNRPIRLLVPFSPGGNADIFVRAVAKPFGETLGQALVIDNRAGSGGVLGTEIAANSAKDGYTLVVGNISTIGVNPALYPKLSYQPVRDFSPVSLMAAAPFVMAVPASLPVQTPQEFIALARSKPGGLNYGSTGIGSPGHLAASLLTSSTAIQMQHVPYKTLGPAFLDMTAGQIHLLFLGIGPAQVQSKTGKIRALAVSSARRSSLIPGLTTVAEAGVPGFDVTGWYGLFLPAGTPATIRIRLHDAMTKVSAMPDLQTQFSNLGAELVSSTPEAFSAFVGGEIKKWAKVVKDSGMRPE